jgi:hypothetical protein
MCVVDLERQLINFTLLTLDGSTDLARRCSERVETATELEKHASPARAAARYRASDAASRTCG